MKRFSTIIEKVPYQLRASFVILVSSFITSAIGFITTPVFARVLSLEEYGLVTQFNSVLEVVTVIATLSLSAGVYQVAMNEYPDDRNSFTFSVMVLSNAATIFVFFIIFLFRHYLVSLLQLSSDLLLCMFVFLLLTPATSLWMARQRYEYQYKKVALVSIITVAFNLSAGIIAIFTIKGYNLGSVKIWATSITQMITGVVIYYSIAKKANWKPRWKYIKYAFVFNAPLLIHYLAQYVLRSSDKLMITAIRGKRETALYGLGTTVASLAMLAWSAMAASLTPYMYEHINKKEYRKVNNASVGVVAIFGLSCFIVSLVGPEIVYILGSNKYMENVQLIPPIAASSILAAIYGIYSTVAFYHHKRKSTAIMTVIAALINIGLNYILIPRYGYIAAAYTTEIAYLIYTILHYINYRNIVKEERIFNDKAIWGITILTTIVCLCSGMIYNTWIARYSILIVITFVMVLRRRNIIQIVKTIMGRER